MPSGKSSGVPQYWRSYRIRDDPPKKNYTKASAPKALVPKKKKKYKSNLSLSKPFKQVLNKYLAPETHWKTQDIPQQNLPCEPQSGVGGIYRIIPDVVQAGVPTVGQPTGATTSLQTRQDSHIKLKSMNLHLLLRLNPAYTANRATGVWYRVMVCTCKNVADYNQFVEDYYPSPGPPPLPGLQTSVFKEGAVPTGYTPLIMDISNPVNTNLFTVHAEKQGYLSKGQVLQPGTGNVYAQSAFRQMKLKLKVKSKILKYNNRGDTIPVNFQPFVMFFWKDLDSFDYTTTTPPPAYVEVSGKCHMSWQDE